MELVVTLLVLLTEPFVAFVRRDLGQHVVVRLVEEPLLNPAVLGPGVERADDLLPQPRFGRHVSTETHLGLEELLLVRYLEELINPHPAQVPVPYGQTSELLGLVETPEQDDLVGVLELQLHRRTANLPPVRYPETVHRPQEVGEHRILQRIVRLPDAHRVGERVLHHPHDNHERDGLRFLGTLPAPDDDVEVLLVVDDVVVPLAEYLAEAPALILLYVVALGQVG